MLNIDILEFLQKRKVDSGILMTNWAITLGYDYVPISYSIILTKGLLEHGWNFLFYLLGEILEGFMEDFQSKGKMEILIHVKDIQNYGYIPWLKILNNFRSGQFS